jgi:UDP-N-acetylglucosamine 2-epimerase
MDLLEETYDSDEWQKRVEEIENPFGDGKAAKRIVDWICRADVMFR